MRAVPLVALLLVATARADDELSIDSFEFEWKVAKVGEATLSVTKDEDKTRVIIRENFESVSLSDAEAEIVGAALAKTSEMSKKLKGTTGKSERLPSGGKVDVGKFDVKFWTSDDGTFYVTIRETAQFSTAGLTIDRETAIAFAPHLKKSKQLVAFVDKKIKL